jgi:hypothetical protein
VEIDFKDYENEYPTYEKNQENLIEVTRKWRDYGAMMSRLQFMTRVTELSHFKNKDRFPTWMKNMKWEKDYIPKGTRTKWERLILFQPEVGKLGVSIRRREFEKSIEVSENFEE